MAFEKWKDGHGGWNNQVVTVVACFGLLLLAGLYYVFTYDLDSVIVEKLNPASPRAETTGTSSLQ